MKKLLEWIKEHKMVTFLIFVAVIFVPIIFIHFLFKTPAPDDFFVATWSSGDLLGYFGDVLSFLGTAILGYVAILQTEKANTISENLMRMDLIKSKPCFDFINLQKYFMTISKPAEELQKLYHSKESMLLEVLYTSQPRSGMTTDIGLLELEVTNNGHSDIRYIYVKKIHFSLLAYDERSTREIIPVMYGNTNLKIKETKKLFIRVKREFLDKIDLNDMLYENNLDKISPSFGLELHIITTDGLDFYEKIECGSNWNHTMKSTKNSIERELVVLNVEVTPKDL